MSNLEGVPIKFRDVTFLNFNADKTSKLYETKKKCYDFAKGRTDKESLLLMGNVGSGKTHLAISIMKEIPSKPSILKYGDPIQPKCLFLNADQFFMKLSNSFNEGISKDMMIDSFLMNYEIVCLDDLSSFNFTPAKTENFYFFINQAYMNNRRIIITTNFDESEFKKIDPRIFSRLKEMCLVRKFINEDYRK